MWPRKRRGVPLTYLAEILTERLPPIPAPWGRRLDWSHGGRVIRVFANVLDNSYEPTVAMVLDAGADASLELTPHPEISDPLPAGGPWEGRGLEDRFWRCLCMTSLRCRS